MRTSSLFARFALSARPTFFGDRKQLAVMVNTLAAAVASDAGTASVFCAVFENLLTEEKIKMRCMSEV